MLLELIFNPVFTAFESLVSMFPTLNISSDILGGMNTFFEVMNSVNYFLPVGYMFLLVFAYWGIVNAKLIISLIAWVYEKIPFI